jgi:hypothetical protein
MSPGFASALEFLRSQPVITLFLALAAGYALGRIRIAGVSFRRASRSSRCSCSPVPH